MSMTTMTRRQAAQAEAQAEASTMRADRRFLWGWLVLATTLSVVGNVGHAFVEAMQRVAGSDTAVTHDPLFWFALGWAAVPPFLLMCAVHGIPVLARMLDEDGNDRLLTVVAWGVVVGAFGWSAFGIYAFTVAVGVPPQLAWLAPAVIDLSVFGATRALVKTAPLAARMKVGMCPASSASQQVKGDSATPAHRVSAISAPQTATPKRVSDRDSATEPRESAKVTATKERESAKVTATKERESAPSDVRELASRIVAAKVTRKGIEDIVAVLEAHRTGAALNRVAADTGVHRDAVAKIIAAAEDADDQDSEATEESRVLAIA